MADQTVLVVSKKPIITQEWVSTPFFFNLPLGGILSFRTKCFHTSQTKTIGPHLVYQVQPLIAQLTHQAKPLKVPSQVEVTC